ncbi:MAG: hypothetical protein NTV87_07085 [Ignavibacteriae bacterium]|nr:hypothetical protein [Ignavibacteriota bacterium]
MISRLLDKVNSGKPEFLKELFMLYNIKLKLGLYNELRVIRYPSLAFRDYIIVGLKLKKNKWVENFIKKYSELKLRLNPDKKEIGYFLNKVSETPNLIAKDWFIEKIMEMKI